MKYIGAHISKKGTLIDTIKHLHSNEGNAIQFFASSPMNSTIPDIEKIKSESKEIIKYCDANNIKIVVHGSYVINLASDNINKRYVEIKDRWWIKLLLKELDSCELLKGVGVVIHVGKHTINTPEKGLEIMFEAIKYIISYLQSNKYNSKLFIETPAGVGTELLTTAETFIKFYNRFNKTDKKYLGICLDTAHIWSSGNDLIQYYNTFNDIYNDIGVIHFNNSKVEKGSLIDRHEFIFSGKINTKCLELFLNNLKSDSIIILEKPSTNLLNEDIKFIKNNFN